ncbi:GtrA family protein [Paenibacillus zeirhizosphaerae]|uniref:GtrA family protein n=1 Tax=Paenibacillus zeirhizosphaerae TaxID=2987519 RepID=UPI003520FF6F
MKILINSEFIRFLIVGVINTIVGLGTIYLLYNIVNLNYWISTSLGNIAGAGCSFYLNRKFTFKVSVWQYRQIYKFAVITLVSYFASYYLGYLLIIFMQQVQLKGILYTMGIDNISILLASGLYTIFNYIGHRYYTFK